VSDGQIKKQLKWNSRVRVRCFGWWIKTAKMARMFNENLALTCIGVNFYKAARLEPLTFQTPIGFRASEPSTFLSHATPIIMKLSSVVYRTIK